MTAMRKPPSTRHPLTEAEEQAIVDLLRQGQAIYRVAATVHRAPSLVSAVREKHGITVLKVGARPAVEPKLDEPEYETCRVADPWIAPAGIAYVERPFGSQWKALVDADPRRPDRYQKVIRRVLGLPATATDNDMVAALTAERRTAESLARAYLEAIGEPC